MLRSPRWLSLLALTATVALLPAAALCSPVTIGNITSNPVSSSRISAIWGSDAFGEPSNPVLEAVGFAVTQDFFVSSVSAAIGNADTPGSGFTLDIYSSFSPSYAIPYRHLYTVGSATPTGSYTNVSTFSTGGLQLDAGSTYWLVASPSNDTTRVYWAMTGTGSFPTAQYSATNYYKWIPNSLFGQSPNDPYFSIQGDTVPEPASLVLFATGLLALAFFARRHAHEV